MGKTAGKKQRNGKIDFLRFFFCIIIMLHHSGYLVGKDQCVMWGGSLAVEFFFIVSGFLMMGTIERSMTQNSSGEEYRLGRETKKFLWKKIMVIYPEAFFGWLIGLAFISRAMKVSLFGSVKLAINNFWELIMLNMSGLPMTKDLNYSVWYISSMLICLAILYPLIRRYPDMATRIILPLIVILIWGYLCKTTGSLRSPSKWLGWTMKGNVRAFADLGLGVVCYQLANRIKAIPWNRIGRIALTVMEFGLYFVFVVYMYFKHASKLDFIFVLFLFIAIAITFSEKSLFLELFQNKVVSFLGKYSVALYFSHFFYAKHLNDILPADLGNQSKMGIYFLLACLTGLVVYGISALWRKYRLTKKIAGFFVQTT